MPAALVRIHTYKHIIHYNKSTYAATSKAMLEALLRLLEDREISCRYYSIITGAAPESPTTLARNTMPIASEDYATLNQSQITAVESTDHPLCLVWGPPGKFVKKMGGF
jgi:hypothetical protein